MYKKLKRTLTSETLACQEVLRARRQQRTWDPPCRSKLAFWLRLYCIVYIPGAIIESVVLYNNKLKSILNSVDLTISDFEKLLGYKG